MNNNTFKVRLISIVSGIAIIIYGVALPLNVIAESEPISQTPEQTISRFTPGDPILEESPTTITIQEEPPSEEVEETTILPIDNTEIDSVQVNQQQITNEASQSTTSGDVDATNNDIVEFVNTGSAESKISLTTIANNISSTKNDASSDLLLLDPSGPNDDVNFGTQPIGVNIPSQQSKEILTGAVILNSTDISNAVVVDTTTGSVNLSDNESLGQVSTGNALTNIEILNMANSIVTSGDSLIGVLNINGDYDGDIILTQDIINKLTADDKNKPLPYSEYSLLKLDEQLIYNNVEVAALTGTILLEDNYGIGSLATGSAQTEVIINNLLSSFVIHDNSLIVIVSVLGGWDGNVLGSRGSNIFILRSPSASTKSSALPVGIRDISIFNSTSISNTVQATSKSGGINLLNNDVIGSASTGNANVNVKIVNSINHVTSFADWLGILFINIFGDWNGSVVQTNQEIKNPTSPISANSGSASKPNISLTNLSSTGFTLSNNSNSIAIGFSGSSQAQPEASEQKDTKSLGAAPINKVSPSNLISESNNTATTWLLFSALMAGAVYSGYKILQYRQKATNSINT